MNDILKKILIKTKKETFSEIIGSNTSKQKAQGYDFSELKEYEYGDDVKNIDWIITAKMQKPYVKVFHSQKELNIKIVNILNGSVYFGTKKLKKDIIIELASALGFISIKQGDPFTSYIANENLNICTKKSKKNFSVNYMAQKLFEYDVLEKKVDYKIVQDGLFRVIHHKSIIFLIGDFFDIEDLNLKMLSKKHEIVVLIIRDKFEENPPKLGGVSFKDPASNIYFDGILNEDAISTYKKHIAINDHKLYNHLQQCKIRFTKVYTDENPIKKLMGVLN